MALGVRESQTRIKHLILQGYVRSWANIIGSSNSLRLQAEKQASQGRPLKLQMAYLDGYSFSGKYDRDADQEPTDEPIWGSPIFAIKSLEGTLTSLATKLPIVTELTALCIEQDPVVFEALQANMTLAQVRTKVEVAERFSKAHHGRVALIRGDCRDHTEDLVQTLVANAWLLAFIDPLGDSMKMEKLQPLVGRKRTDCIILFPIKEVAKHAGAITKPLEQRTKIDHINISRTDDLFGSTDWQEIAKDFPTSKEREPEFVKLYQRLLEAIDPELVVKRIGLRFSQFDQMAYYLFLTTRDADGALRMNDLLRKAEIHEHLTLYQDRVARAKAKDELAGLGKLFGDDELLVAPKVSPSQPLPDEIEGFLLEHLLKGKTYSKKDVYRVVRNTDYKSSEVDSALRKLRKGGVLSFTDLKTVNSVIQVLVT